MACRGYKAGRGSWRASPLSYSGPIDVSGFHSTEAGGQWLMQAQPDALFWGPPRNLFQVLWLILDVIAHSSQAFMEHLLALRCWVFSSMSINRRTHSTPHIHSRKNTTSEIALFTSLCLMPPGAQKCLAHITKCCFRPDSSFIWEMELGKF
jgi:hypothetical protein